MKILFSVKYLGYPLLYIITEKDKEPILHGNKH